MQEEKKVFQVQLFQGVEHGFALRGDINNAYESKSCWLTEALSCN